MPVVLIQQERPNVVRKPRRRASAIADELLACCPECKTLETLHFTDGSLMPTRKFSQEESRVYHNCGSSKPCRLYRIF